MDDEILLLHRLLALYDERTSILGKLKEGTPVLEQLAKTENEIRQIKQQLREFYGY